MRVLAGKRKQLRGHFFGSGAVAVYIYSCDVTAIYFSTSFAIYLCSWFEENYYLTRRLIHLVLMSSEKLYEVETR